MQSVEQTLRQRHVEVRNRLWPVRAKPEKAPEPIITVPVIIPTIVTRTPSKMVWVRQYNNHVIAFRRWQLAEESGREYVPLADRPEVNAIINDVLADFPGVTMEEIKGPRRHKRVVLARQIAMYEVCRQRQDLSYPQIGRFFGGKDHTTCLHAVRKIAKERGPARG